MSEHTTRLATIMTHHSAQNNSNSPHVLQTNTTAQILSFDGEVSESLLASTISIRPDVLTGCSVHVWLINRQAVKRGIPPSNQMGKLAASVGRSRALKVSAGGGLQLPTSHQEFFSFTIATGSSLSSRVLSKVDDTSHKKSSLITCLSPSSAGVAATQATFQETLSYC